MPMSQSEDAWTTYSGASALAREEFDRLVWYAANARGRNRKTSYREALRLNYTGTWSDVESLLATAINAAKYAGVQIG